MVSGNDPKSDPPIHIDGLTLGDNDEFRSLFGRGEPTTTATGPAGTSIEVVTHELLGLSCVSMVTKGLARLGRAELVLTVSAEVLARATSGPAEVLKALTAALENGPLLGPGAFLGMTRCCWPRMAGFVLERAQPMAGVTLPSGCLAMHVLVDEEVAAVDAMGPLRVVARVAQRLGCWPPVALCDPWRPAVAAPDEPSVLRRVTTVHAPGVRVAVERSTIVLGVGRAALPMLSELPSGRRGSYAMFASLDPQADALLSWEPGAKVANANAGGRGSANRIAGCFFAAASGASEDRGGPTEDGFVMTLTEASAARLHAALCAGQPLEIPSANGLGLRVEWHGELA